MSRAGSEFMNTNVIFSSSLKPYHNFGPDLSPDCLLMLPPVVIPEASSIMRALSGARFTGVRLYTLCIKIGTNQRALGEHSHY